MKITYKQARAFERGMSEGVHRLFAEDSSIQAVRCGYSTKRDVAAFVAGYTLVNTSDMYFFAWKGDRHLLTMALQSGDIKAHGWNLYHGTIEAI